MLAKKDGEAVFQEWSWEAEEKVGGSKGLSKGLRDHGCILPT
jgi:hypothetical protein